MSGVYAERMLENKRERRLRAELQEMRTTIRLMKMMLDDLSESINSIQERLDEQTVAKKETDDAD